MSQALVYVAVRSCAFSPCFLVRQRKYGGICVSHWYLTSGVLVITLPPLLSSLPPLLSSLLTVTHTTSPLALMHP